MVETTDGTVIGRVGLTDLVFVSGYTLSGLAGLNTANYTLTATGLIHLESSVNLVSAIRLLANGGADATIRIQNTDGIGDGVITLDTPKGGINLVTDITSGVLINGGGFTATTTKNLANVIRLATNGGTAETIVLTNTQGTATKAIEIDAIAGGVDISAAGVVAIAGTGGTNISAAVFTGGAITGVITLTVADSGRTYSVVQTGGGYVVTLPTTATGLNYKFVVITEAGGATTITASGAHLFGSYDLGGTSTQIPGHTSILFDATDANVGDVIELNGIDATHWLVTARSTDASGISTAA